MLQEHLPKDIKHKIFDVTYALYRVTSFFPEDETLAADLRKEASTILKLSAKYNTLPHNSFDEIIDIISRIRGTRTLLLLAEANRFVSSINIDVLNREYGLIESFFTNKLNQLTQSSPRREHGKKEARKNRNLRSSGTLDKDARSPIPHVQEEVLIERGGSGGEKKSEQERHTHILEVLGKKDKVSIKDIAIEFDDVSAKTIQRDLQQLIEKNLVFREGERRWAVYSIRRVGREGGVR